MFDRFKRCPSKKNKDYFKSVDEYIKLNGMKVTQRLYNSFYENSLDAQMVTNLLGGDFPKAPWIAQTNILDQFICLMEQVGYEFASKEGDKVYLDKDGIYEAVVQNHLKHTGRDILTRLSECCEKTHGRISYPQMNEILGRHYPKALKSSSVDNRICIIIFLNQVGLLFRFDENHVYFP